MGWLDQSKIKIEIINHCLTHFIYQYTYSIISIMPRCQFTIKDKSTHRLRKCKHQAKAPDNYCQIHNQSSESPKLSELGSPGSQISQISQMPPERPETPGECCFCGNPCNPLSQSCGRCPREFWSLNSEIYKQL